MTEEDRLHPPPPAGGISADGAGTGSTGPLDFIRAIVAEDVRTNKHGGRVVTRFPPEPNGYLHIGHTKAISLDFGIAAEFGGKYNLRFDDTNPVKEDVEYVDAIIEDLHWLGWDWEDRLYYASDYFERLYLYAEQLIREGKAYVCSLPPEKIREYRGTLTEPGKNSPYRDRPVEENLDLFRRMRAGEFPDGAHVLRAKIDMASPNLNMRDPVVYRIRRAHHHRTGDTWCIYPMYDFTHCLSDSLEGITHSLCSLEFEDHRPLYDWFLDELRVECHPQQIEFARLHLTHTVMSKRKLRQLVEERHVSGWDDPRMPTLCGLRRRGYTPEAIKDFLGRIGVAKRDSVVDIALLEHCLREDLNHRAPRAMAVLNPLRLVIDNYPQGLVEEMEVVNNPEDPSAGTRRIPFSRELYIEQDDFREIPPPKYYRLSPGKEVRLRAAYLITCNSVIKDPVTNAAVEIHCTYDPATRGGSAPDGRKVKSTIHWVSAAHAAAAEVRLYDHLFLPETTEADGDDLALESSALDSDDTGGSNGSNESDESNKSPDGGDSVGKRSRAGSSGDDWTAQLNPDSLKVLPGCMVEPGLAAVPGGARFQFERLGYFCVDSVDSKPGHLVFNRAVSLRDTWAKIEHQTVRKGGGM